ncbi:Hsp20/alpha crystallin family protein [Kribbella sp.]|uniref:Hsp20/alpha crystallin family protein n=1 Tax=Kribbella sp. TaxID=1871183 RepID=UPI002D2D725C|nr:Hsp20/alpha crystallin family protein [Kribbella sp.]HZX02818.1 Hsp20/alpha crystallin family protein [Kribbella sp.]
MALPARTARNDTTRWDPAGEFERLTQQLSRLFDDRWADVPSMLREGFTPLADLEETDNAYVLEVELPGVKKKEINIDLDGRRLVISGERPEQQRTGWLRRQTRSWGRFHYEVVLPDNVDPDGVEATLDDGVLRVTVAKGSTGQRRHVDVK